MKKTSEIYKKLYHYTTWSGLRGILETQSLWATHFRFLNDFSEIVLFKEKLTSILIPKVKEGYENLIIDRPQIKEKINNIGGLEHAVEHDTKACVNAQYNAIGEEIYILSFCGQHQDNYINNNGLLSQWRGYGVDGGGYAIVFDTKEIENILEIEAEKFDYSFGQICDVIYSDNEQKFKEELSPELDKIAQDIKKLFNHQNCTESVPDLNSFHSFLKCISRYKHCGFKEENEVRIVALPTIFDKEFLDFVKEKNGSLKTEKERKFRNSDGKYVPYIELLNSPEIPLPIEKIIVGPHRDKELRASSLKALLRNSNIEISISDIPYIG